MKVSSALAMVLGLTSAAAFAQSQYQPSGQYQSPNQYPSSGAYPAAAPVPAQPVDSAIGMPGMQPMQPGQPGQPGQESAGSSSAAGAADTGGSGQLITESIARSHGDANRTITLQAQTENGITYLCGGVGSDEANYLKTSAARDFDLTMTFAANTGSYLANVDVEIADARGNTLVQTSCDGPLMLVDFPQSGTYRIRAQAAGRTLDRTVHIRDKGHTQAVFAWPRGPSDEGMARGADNQSGAASSGDSDNGSAAGPAHKRYGYEVSPNGR